MSSDQMRAEFEAWADTQWGRHDRLWTTWQVAYRAGMEQIATKDKRIAELERGEYICKKCGLRKDAEFERGDF